MSDGPHQLEIRVYYEDTDFSGVVYHANYLRYLERGRTELLRASGVEQAAMRHPASGQPMAFAVRHMAIDFLRAARMDDIVMVETRLAEAGGASLLIDQTIRRGDTALVQARVKIALVMDGRACRLPPDLLRKLGGDKRSSAVAS